LKDNKYIIEETYMLRAIGCDWKALIEKILPLLV
jgi:hypothetical protein